MEPSATVALTVRMIRASKVCVCADRQHDRHRRARVDNERADHLPRVGSEYATPAHARRPHVTRITGAHNTDSQSTRVHCTDNVHGGQSTIAMDETNG